MSEARAGTPSGFTRMLARRRVALGFVCGAFVLWLAEPTFSTLEAGAAIALVGEGLRVWASGHLNKAREVTRSGPYRWFAHPLYVGSSIMGVGVALAANSFVVTAIIGFYLVTTLTAAIGSEEAFLREAFGERYDRYRRGGSGVAGDREVSGTGDRTEGDERRRFSSAQAMANREYRAVVGLLAALLLLALKATYNDGSL